MARTLRWTRILVFGGLLLMVLLVPASAVADEGDPPPVIAFLDNRDLVIDLDYLRDELGGEVVVYVRNNDPEQTHRVELRLVGLVPLTGEPVPNLAALLPTSSAVEEVPPLETRAFTLAFHTQEMDDPPAAGSYEGVLVATGGGDVARRKLTLQVVALPEPTEELGESVLLPAQMEELTLRGINFLPSLISPLWPAVLLSGLAVLTLRLALSWLNLEWEQRVQRWLLIGGVVLLVAGGLLGLLVQADVLSVIQPSLVRVRTVPLPASDGLAQVGQVTADDGGVGLLVHAEDRLEVRRIPRAGAYTGKMDLLPGDEEQGQVSVTVNVSDWWPYAFITLVLGVLLGAYLARYYKDERERDRAEARTAELWLEACQAESDFQRANAGRPQSRYTIHELACGWIDAAREDLSKDDVAGANASLDKLEAFIDQFHVLRDKLERLDALYLQTRRLFEQRTLGLGVEDVDAFRTAESTLGGEQVLPLSFITEKQAEEQISACVKHVGQVIDWLQVLEDTLQFINWCLDYIAEHIDVSEPGWTKERVNQLSKQRQTLENQGRAALVAGTTGKVAEAMAVADKARLEILRLEKEAKSAANIRLVEPDLLLLQPMRTVESLAAEALKTATVEEKAVLPQVLDMESWVEPTPTGFEEGNVDDLVVLSAQVTFPPPLTREYDYQVRWDFGDGSFSMPFRLRPGEVTTIHRFNKPGSYTVALRDAAGRALATCPLTVRAEPSRSAALLQAFRLDEKRMTFISGLLTVGSGLLLLYFGDQAWGTPADYLKTFLWGSVISESAKEGARIVNNLVGRKWPLNT